MISYVHKTDSIYTSYNRGGSRDSVDGGGGGLKNDILCTVYILATTGADPETLLTGGGLSCGAIFSIIDGTNCSPKAFLACRSVNLVFISFSVQ